MKCIECGKEIYGKHLCRSCYQLKRKEQQPVSFCIDCGEELSKHIYTRCKDCRIKHRTGKNHPMFGRKGKDSPLYTGGKARLKKDKPCIDCGKLILRQSIRCPDCRHKGKLHPNYIDGCRVGKSKKYPKEFNEKLKERIRSRDNQSCQMCGKKEQEERVALCVHHIDYKTTNNKESNLIALCSSCHTQTNFKRDKWQEKFKKIRVLV